MRRIFSYSISLTVCFIALNLYSRQNGNVSNLEHLLPEKDYSKFAEEEIASPQRLTRDTPSKSSATIKVVIPENKKEIKSSSTELGIALSPYKPRGEKTLSGYKEFAYDKLSYKPSPRLKINWMPLSFSSNLLFSFYKTGLFFDFSYSQHKIDLQTSTGSKVKNTKLHSIITNFGLSAEAQILKTCQHFLGFKTGMASIGFFQSSDYGSATFTQEKAALIVSPYFKYSFSKNFKIVTSYEYRHVLTNEGNEIADQRHNVFIGLMGVLD